MDNFSNTNFKELKRAFFSAKKTYESLYYALKSMGIVEAKSAIPDVGIKTVAKSGLIVEWTEEEFKVKVVATGRKHSIVRARHAVAYLLEKYTGLNQKQIAQCCGLEDHTSAMHSKKVCIRLMTKEVEYRNTVEKVESRILKYFKS